MFKQLNGKHYHERLGTSISSLYKWPVYVYNKWAVKVCRWHNHLWTSWRRDWDG